MKKQLLTVISLAGVMALSGCTSATRGTVNPVPVTQPDISPTLMAEDTRALKRVVAISRFSDETKRSNSFLVDYNGDRLGKQASDILASRLTDSNKFIMLERDALNAVQTEAKYAGKALESVGADYLIVGSVSEFGRSTNSEVGVFSRNKIQIATATVNVRLINTRNGEIIYSEEATGEARTEANRVFGVGETAGYDTSLDDKAVSAAISKLVSNIMENLLDAPWQAYLVGVDQGFYMMTGGESQNVKVGDNFTVYTEGKRVKNPQTGMMITLPGKPVAEIEVMSLVGKGQNELSLCRLKSGDIDNKALASLVVREAEGAQL